MKTLITTLLLVAGLATPAAAISRYNIDGMSCGQAQAKVRSEGAAILRYSSKSSGMTLYNKFVRDERFCQSHEIATLDYVPTADRASCPIKRCETRSRYLDDDEWLWRR